MNIKVIIGLALGYCIGLGCSLLSIPVPAPPALVGALLVVAMSTGYVVTDKYLMAEKKSTQTQQCGGPTGEQCDD